MTSCLPAAAGIATLPHPAANAHGSEMGQQVWSEEGLLALVWNFPVVLFLHLWFLLFPGKMMEMSMDKP